MAVTHLLLLIAVTRVHAWERLTIEKIEAVFDVERSFKFTVEIDSHRTAWPNGLYELIMRNQTRYTNIEHFFEQRTIVRLFEYNAKHLTSITIANEGTNYTRRVSLLALAYWTIRFAITFSVEHNVQDTSRMKSIMCGTTKCKYCDVDLLEKPCHDTNILGLDQNRDMDKSDIRYCPPGYTHAEYKNYTQIGSRTLYLRICSPITEPLVDASN